MLVRVAFLIAILSLFGFLQAGPTIPLSIAELSEHADLVVHGTVLKKTCQRDSANRLYTRIVLRPIDIWKGDLESDLVTVVHGGGILGNRKAIVSNQVHYGMGEEVVAFLVFNDRGEGVTVGLFQGKFGICRDARTGVVSAWNPFHGIAGGQQSASGFRDNRKPLLTLEQLRGTVLGFIP